MKWKENRWRNERHFNLISARRLAAGGAAPCRFIRQGIRVSIDTGACYESILFGFIEPSLRSANCGTTVSFTVHSRPLSNGSGNYETTKYGCIVDSICCSESLLLWIRSWWSHWDSDCVSFLIYRWLMISVREYSERIAVTRSISIDQNIFSRIFQKLKLGNGSNWWNDHFPNSFRCCCCCWGNWRKWRSVRALSRQDWQLQTPELNCNGLEWR